MFGFWVLFLVAIVGGVCFLFVEFTILYHCISSMVTNSKNDPYTNTVNEENDRVF